MTKDGYCEDHSRKGVEQDRHRASASERGYNWRWTKRAKAFKLKIENALCAVCVLEGIVTPTEDIHHIDPVSSGGKVHVRDDELLPVCVRCHRRVEGLGYGWRSVVGKR